MTLALLAASLALAAPPLIYDDMPALQSAGAPEAAAQAFFGFTLLEPGEALRDSPGKKATIVPEEDVPAADLKLVGRPGWAYTKSSLLLYDSSGTLSNEVGLGRWDEDGPDNTIRRRTVRGGASKDGRFAWSLEAAEQLKRGRTEKTLSSARLFRYLGTSGGELFRNELADAPFGLEPAALAENGEHLLVAERGPDAWIVAAYDFVGNRLVDAHGRGLIEVLTLSPNGLFALIRWHQLDQPPSYTLIDIEDRKTKDAVPSKTPLAAVRVGDDGRVFSGPKVLFSIR